VSTLVVTEFITLDGVVEAPGGEPGHPHSGWAFDFVGPQQMAFKLAEVLAAESLLIGRATYEGFAAAWPERDGEFADKMNAMPKYVVSSTLSDPKWRNTTVLAGDWVTQVTSLKARDGGPLLVAGSATLVRELFALGLVDELRLMVFPVMVGGGLRCFAEGRERLPFDLVESEVYTTGVVLNTYRKAAA
jgi:dihydrofolate reductase